MLAVVVPCGKPPNTAATVDRSDPGESTIHVRHRSELRFARSAGRVSAVPTRQPPNPQADAPNPAPTHGVQVECPDCSTAVTLSPSQTVDNAPCPDCGRADLRKTPAQFRRGWLAQQVRIARMLVLGTFIVSAPFALAPLLTTPTGSTADVEPFFDRVWLFVACTLGCWIWSHYQPALALSLGLLGFGYQFYLWADAAIQAREFVCFESLVAAIVLPTLLFGAQAAIRLRLHDRRTARAPIDVDCRTRDRP